MLDFVYKYTVTTKAKWQCLKIKSMQTATSKHGAINNDTWKLLLLLHSRNNNNSSINSVSKGKSQQQQHHLTYHGGDEDKRQRIME
jgi:hypothetical protein